MEAISSRYGYVDLCSKSVEQQTMTVSRPKVGHYLPMHHRTDSQLAAASRAEIRVSTSTRSRAVCSTTHEFHTYTLSNQDVLMWTRGNNCSLHFVTSWQVELCRAVSSRAEKCVLKHVMKCAIKRLTTVACRRLYYASLSVLYNQ